MQERGRDQNFIPPDVRMGESIPNEEYEPTGGEESAFNLSGLLESINYPATKEDIIDYATDSGVEEQVLDMLEQLPDTTYNNPTDVSQAIGEEGD